MYIPEETRGAGKIKRWTIITYKHGICELPHELPNDLKQRILGN